MPPGCARASESVCLLMEMIARSASGLSQTGNYLRVRHSIAISRACLILHLPLITVGARCAAGNVVFWGSCCTFRLLLPRRLFRPLGTRRPQLTGRGHLWKQGCGCTPSWNRQGTRVLLKADTTPGGLSLSLRL